MVWGRESSRDVKRLDMITIVRGQDRGMPPSSTNWHDTAIKRDNSFDSAGDLSAFGLPLISALTQQNLGVFGLQKGDVSSSNPVNAKLWAG
jgi:hypothetical protein